MNSSFRWLIIGTLLGLGASMGVSCGAAKCTAQNCAFGCCDAAGTCQQGSADSQCGSAGATCSACVLGQSCQLGRCVSNFGTGGGTGQGGGTSSNGGGTTTGGGTATGGGSQQTGGGSQQTGGGSATGGGSGTGGGSQQTGGGTGGGFAALCTRLGNAQTRFFAGQTVCSNGTITLENDGMAAARCNSAASACSSSSDQAALGTFASCLENTTTCTSGNESAAVNGFMSCANAVGNSISTACSNANSGTGGGGGTGGGTGGGGGGSTGGGGGTVSCTTVSFPQSRSYRSFSCTSTTYFDLGSSASDPTDVLSIEFWWPSTVPSLPFSDDLSTYADYQACVNCAIYRRGCTWTGTPTTPSCTGGSYLGRSGTVTIQSAPQNMTGSMTASWTTIRFDEWNFSTDSIVSGGRCFNVTAGSGTVSIQTPPP